jgi:hypothetical protein
MSADKPTLDAEYIKRQRRIDELESSVNEKIGIIAAISEDDGAGDEGTHMGGGEPPHGLKMATESELRAAEIAAAEARTDTKITRMEGKLDLVISKLDGVREDNRATRANQWVVGLGLAVLIVAIATLFPVLLDFGAKIREMVVKEVHEVRPLPPPPANIPR